MKAQSAERKEQSVKEQNAMPYAEQSERVAK
jgi:hypothetical protein